MSTVETTSQQAADAVLRAFVVDDSGVFISPIDPFALAGQVGVDVFRTPLSSGLSGFIAKPSEDVPAKIFVNSSQSEVRQRFTVAHELGHFFYEGMLGNQKFDTLKREEGHSDTGEHVKERWANAFAASLLMPGGPIRALCASGKTPREMASMFDVSEAAMNIRLAKLGL